MPQRIQRSRAKGYRMPPECVSVTRPGKFGNPYKVGDQCPTCDHPNILLDTPERVVAAFREYAEAKLTVDPNWLEPLRDKDLACFCPLDQPCHANVLIELANYRDEDWKVPITNRQCDWCGRREGSTADREGGDDGVPLGELRKCPRCDRHLCPECIDTLDCDDHTEEE